MAATKSRTTGRDAYAIMLQGGHYDRGRITEYDW